MTDITNKAPAAIKAGKSAAVKCNTKLCRYCQTEKPLMEFRTGERKCKACTKAQKRTWYEANKEVAAARQADHRKKNKEAISARQAVYRKKYNATNKQKINAANAEWRRANKEKVAAISAAWYEANKERAANNSIRRRRAAKGQTPAWADNGAILAVYREAREFRAAGVPATVEHIVPLRGKLVSGLHCEANLTIKLASWNFGKCNKFDPLTFNNEAPLEQAT